MQPEYPNLIFAKDGEIYMMNGLRYLVIGGAYSVDKYYRLSRGWNWWPDEQPSPEIKAYVEQQIREKHLDIVLSHTCPFKYEPAEMFLDLLPAVQNAEAYAEKKAFFDKVWTVLMCRREGERLDTKTAVTRHENMKRRL